LLLDTGSPWAIDLPPGGFFFFPCFSVFFRAAQISAFYFYPPLFPAFLRAETVFSAPLFPLSDGCAGAFFPFSLIPF